MEKEKQLKESTSTFVSEVSNPKPLTNEEVMNIVNDIAQLPRSIKLGEFERGKLNVAINPEMFAKVEAIFENFNSNLPADARALQLERKRKFEEKLAIVAERMSRGEKSFEYPLLGEEFITPRQLRDGDDGSTWRKDPGVIAAGRPDLVLPDTLTKDELIQLARLKYIVEAMGIGHIIAGYTKSLIDLWKGGTIPTPSNIHFILRDGRVAFATAKGFAQQDERYSLKQSQGEIKASYINSAMASPLVKDDVSDLPRLIYTKNEDAITKDEALQYFKQIGVLDETNSELLSLLADTASMGTIPITLDRARRDNEIYGKIAMITLAGGWQGSPLIPNYVRYLASGYWLADPENEDPIVLKKTELVHTYAENSFAGYTKRPERFIHKPSLSEKQEDLLAVPISPYNAATSLLAWVSIQAGYDVGEVHGLMSKNGEPLLNELPQKALDLIWSLWTHSTGTDPKMPNILFCPWGPRHAAREGIMARWRTDILEDLGLK